MDDGYLNDTLDYTNARRRKLVDLFEKQNDGVAPTDPDSARLYLKTLSDMDNSALTHARVKTEEKAADNDAAVATIIRDVVRKLDGRNPYKLDNPSPDRQVPELPTDIENSIVIDDALLETGKVQETVDEFTERLNLNDD